MSATSNNRLELFDYYRRPRIPTSEVPSGGRSMTFKKTEPFKPEMTVRVIRERTFESPVDRIY